MTIINPRFTQEFYISNMAFLLAHYGRKQLATYTNSLERARARNTTARIHALRVSMKQLRTLLRLAEGTDTVTDAPSGPVRRLLALFKAAGELRETQVSTALVTTFEKLDPADGTAYLAHLKRRRNKAAKALRRALADGHARDARKLGKYFASVSTDRTHTQERRSARLYVDREMRKAMGHVRAGAHGDALHDVRKHLKNAWHTLRLLKEADTLTERQNALLERLGGVQAGLGEWHDLQVVYEDLEKHEEQDEVAFLKKAIGTILRSERTRLLREMKQVLEA
ncbi:MAG: CHAD domain-containing protein [Flavobacteriales bacterium]